jgi:predicted Zn-dependent protease
VAPLARGGDVWLSSSPALDAQAAGDYGRYALLHEIGHAIGLDHPDASDEVMSFRYTERFRTLQAGDIHGAVQIYGPRKSLLAHTAK